VEIRRDIRVELIKEELRLGNRDEDGWWSISHGDREVGLMRQIADDQWRLSVKMAGWDEWIEKRGVLTQGSSEVAEAWALHEVATFIAMKEEVEERDHERGSER
jgi:hypothetical protein